MRPRPCQSHTQTQTRNGLSTDQTSVWTGTEGAELISDVGMVRDSAHPNTTSLLARGLSRSHCSSASNLFCLAPVTCSGKSRPRKPPLGPAETACRPPGHWPWEGAVAWGIS